MNFLFKSFLEDKKTYFECVKHWENLFKKTFPNVAFQKYFKTTFVNGEDFFDGNPIYNLKLINSNKAIFIVQEEPESDSVYFKAWIDKYKAEEEVEKLVIVLELTEKSEYLAIDLAKEWIANSSSVNEIEKTIQNWAEVRPCKIGNKPYSELFNTEPPAPIKINTKNKSVSSNMNIKLSQLLEI